MALASVTDQLFFVPLKRTDTVDWAKCQRESPGLDVSEATPLRQRLVDVSAGKARVTEETVASVLHAYCRWLFQIRAAHPLEKLKPFTWHSLSGKTHGSGDSTFELGCVIFDTAAACTVLAQEADVKTAYKRYEMAAFLFHAAEETLSGAARPTVDISTEALAMLEHFALTAAQHCAYRQAEQNPPGRTPQQQQQFLSKLAMESSVMYRKLLRLMAQPTQWLSEFVERSWPKYAEFYQRLLEARSNAHLASAHQSALEKASEIVRLRMALAVLEPAQRIVRDLPARFGDVHKAATQHLRTRLDAAIRENNSVNHERIPEQDFAPPADMGGKLLAKLQAPPEWATVASAVPSSDPVAVPVASPLLPPPEETPAPPAAFQPTPQAMTPTPAPGLTEGWLEATRKTGHIRQRLTEIASRVDALGVVGLTSVAEQRQGPRDDVEVRHFMLALQDECRASGGCVTHLGQRLAAIESPLNGIFQSIETVERILLEEAQADAAIRAELGAHYPRPPSEAVNGHLWNSVNQIRSQAQTFRATREQIEPSLPEFSQLDLPVEQLVKDCIATGSNAQTGGKSGAGVWLPGLAADTRAELNRFLAAHDAATAALDAVMIDLSGPAAAGALVSPQALASLDQQLEQLQAAYSVLSEKAAALRDALGNQPGDGSAQGSPFVANIKSLGGRFRDAVRLTQVAVAQTRGLEAPLAALRNDAEGFVLGRQLEREDWNEIREQRQRRRSEEEAASQDLIARLSALGVGNAPRQQGGPAPSAPVQQPPQHRPNPVPVQVPQPQPKLAPPQSQFFQNQHAPQVQAQAQPQAPPPQQPATEERVCEICFERPRQVILPCGHRVMCSICVLSVQKTFAKCPLCDAQYSNWTTAGDECLGTFVGPR